MADASSHYSVGDVFGIGVGAISKLKARIYQTLPVSRLSAREIDGMVMSVSPSGTITVVQSSSGIVPVVTEGNIE